MSLILTCCCVLLLVLLLYKYILHPALFSPLAQIPCAHPTSAVSPLWILWTRFRFRENSAIDAAHQTYGPVVRLGPNEVSINCYEEGIRTIYGGGFEKHAWYPNLFHNYDGVPNMFSTAESRPHSARKRMMSNVYSKSHLQNSPTMAAISRILIHDRLLPKLLKLATAGPVELISLFNAATMDFVTAYQFGLRNSTNFIEQDDVAGWWLQLYQCRKKFVFWPQELPGVAQIMSTLGVALSPPFVANANEQLEKHCQKMCDAADGLLKDSKMDEEAHLEDVPTVFRQLKMAMSTDAGKIIADTPSYVRLSVASDMLDHLCAGEETSAITLLFVFYELARNPDIQAALRDEVLQLTPQIRPTLNASSSPPSLPSAKSIDNLPLLHAVLLETLRVHPAIPGSQPRITPHIAGGTTLGGFKNIPGGVRVSAQAYSLHRNPRAFPSPHEFRPARWLPDSDGVVSVEEDARRKADMHRHFWAFSSGGRMCIGSNLAMQEMKLITAAIVSNFRVGLDHEDQVLVQEDAYTAQPLSEKFCLHLVALEAHGTNSRGHTS